MLECPPNKNKVVNEIIIWFKKNKRDFPWRHTKNPYYVLIAELLLQRTRAENVAEIYKDFLKKYPDVWALADANVNDIEVAISTLGLKKRAKSLKDISTNIVDNFDGKVPDSEEKLLGIKGIGYYIAYAVLCFAYGKGKAVVDCNVARVTNRIWGFNAKSSPHTNKKFISFTQSLLNKSNPRKYNWAILDFAALVCKPRNPNCANCPINNLCLFYKNSNVD